MQDWPHTIYTLYVIGLIEMTVIAEAKEYLQQCPPHVKSRRAAVLIQKMIGVMEENEKRLALIDGAMGGAYDPNEVEYRDMEALNFAHKLAAGWPIPDGL